MMKKILSVLISVLFVFCAAITVFADEELFGEVYSPFVEENPDTFVPEYDIEEYDGIDVDDFENNDEEINFYLDDESDGYSVDYEQNEAVKERKVFSIVRVIAAAVIGFLAAFIIMKAVAAPLKSVRKSDNANCYEVDNSFNLTYRNERFLYKNVRKSVIQKQEQIKK